MGIDIGRHFPDDSATYRNIDSRILLREVVDKLRQQQLCVHNADITIVAQTPRLAAYIDQMRQLMADDLQIDVAYCNVKATTTEHMGFVGRKEGIASYAVALLDNLA